MKYESFVSESEAAFMSSEATGTPTMLVSGTERQVFRSGPLAEWVTDPSA